MQKLLTVGRGWRKGGSTEDVTGHYKPSASSNDELYWPPWFILPGMQWSGDGSNSHWHDKRSTRYNKLSCKICGKSHQLMYVF